MFTIKYCNVPELFPNRNVRTEQLCLKNIQSLIGRLRIRTRLEHRIPAQRLRKHRVVYQRQLSFLNLWIRSRRSVKNGGRHYTVRTFFSWLLLCVVTRQTSKQRDDKSLRSATTYTHRLLQMKLFTAKMNN